jgi:4-amino-4-deoxy-L-arabinose transferase-like glycosyltransferase
MSFGMKVGTDEAGLLFWPLIALLIVRIARGANPKLWLLIGLIAGLSVESKYSVLFFLAALLLGLLATSQRRTLLNPWVSAGAGAGLVIALPYVLWQLHYGLPMLELLRNGQNGKNLIPSAPLYALQELIITNPLLALEWIIGLIWVLRKPPFRFLGYAYIVLIGEMLLLHGKHYYPANIYPILMAAGAVPIEAWTAQLTISRVLVTAYMVVAGLVMIPDVLPILPEEAFISYAAQRARITHISNKATETEHGREDNLLPSD